MDRNKLWDRTKKAYDLLVSNIGQECNSYVNCLQNAYSHNISDEYIPPYRDWETDRKSTRLNSSHITRSRMPSSA